MGETTPEASGARAEDSRNWTGLAMLGVLLVGLVFVWRVMMSHVSDAPITEPYVGQLNDLSSKSPNAAAFLAAYYRRTARETVSGTDFLVVCEAMRRLAEADGVALPAYPGQSSRSACVYPVQR